MRPQDAQSRLAVFRRLKLQALGPPASKRKPRLRLRRATLGGSAEDDLALLDDDDDDLDFDLDLDDGGDEDA